MIKFQAPKFKFNKSVLDETPHLTKMPYGMAMCIIQLLKEVEPRRVSQEIAYYHALINDIFMAMDDKTNWGIYASKNSKHIVNDITLNCLSFIKILSEPFRNVTENRVFSTPIDDPTTKALLNNDLNDQSSLESIEYLVKYYTAYSNSNNTHNVAISKITEANNPTLVSNAKAVMDADTPNTLGIEVITDRFSSFLKLSNITDVRQEMLDKVYTKEFIRRCARNLSILYNLFGTSAMGSCGCNEYAVESTTEYHPYVYQIPYRSPETAILTTSPKIFRYPTAQLSPGRYMDYVNGYFHYIFKILN